MAKHAAPQTKTPSHTTRIWIWTSVGVIFLAAVVLFVCNGGVALVSAWLSTDTTSTTSSTSIKTTTTTTTSTTTTTTNPPDDMPNPDDTPAVEPEFARPAKLRSAWLRKGVDYATDDDDTVDDIKRQLATAFVQMEKWGINVVMVPLFDDGKALYASEKYSRASEEDWVAYILALAELSEIYVYGVLDMSIAGDLTTIDGEKKAAELAADAAKCGVEGYFLSNYTTKGDGDFAAFIAAGGGDRKAFVRERITKAMNAAAQAFRKANVNNYIGLLAEPLWATTATHEEGCDLKGLTASYELGADTRLWVKKGIFDCVMVSLPLELDEGEGPFRTAYEWWGALCQGAELPLYVSHDANKKWDSPDRLAQQLLLCKNSDMWSGSAFDGYMALKKDKSGSTDALFKVYSGTILPEYISDKLIVSKPTKTHITVKESQYTFSGSADPNFSLTVNGKAIALSEHGFFTWTTTLEPGENVFRFSHKGETRKFTITYAVTVIDSVYPQTNITLDGGSTLNISAIIRKDSVAYAEFNGEKLTMTASPLQTDEDGIKDLSDFENFSCSYTLPEGIINQEQSLGKVKVFASFDVLKEEMEGGSVTVAALPEPEPEPEPTPDDGPMPDGTFHPGNLLSTPKIPDTVVTIDPSVGGEKIAEGKLMVVVGDFAQTYRSDSANMSRPDYAYLPRGTTDMVVGTLVESSGTYYKLLSGRLIKANREIDAFPKADEKYAVVSEIYKDNGTITANTLTGSQVNVGKDYTVLYLGTLWRVPYDFKLAPEKYYSNSRVEQAVDPDYTLRDQVAEYIDITFHYTTTVPETPDISKSPLFKKAEWIKNDDGYYVLRLHLEVKGAFYGYSAAWDNSGNLILSFQHPVAVSQNSSDKPLEGFKLVLDPGHGGGYGRDEYSPGVQEHLQCMQFSLLLKEKLEKLGATVVLTRDNNDISPDLYDRTVFARNTDADMFISIHMNAYNGTVRGNSTHYFNSYSFDLAVELAKRGAKTYKEHTGSDMYIRDSGTEVSFNRGAKWDPFVVTRLHDCPSVLIECGFLDNKDDRELLINPEFQSDYCDNLVDGILAYYSSISLAQKVPNVSTTTTSSTATSTQTSTTNTDVTTTGTASSGETTATTAQTTPTAAQTTPTAALADNKSSTTTVQ